jgi:hypothetical protein
MVRSAHLTTINSVLNHFLRKSCRWNYFSQKCDRQLAIAF